MPFLDESKAELAILDLIRGLGYQYAYGPDIAPDGDQTERATYGDVVLVERLRAARAA